MSILTRQQILAANDKKQLQVEVEEWGGEVLLVEMSACSLSG